MSELLRQFWDELIGRADGPLTLRLFLQPVMAAIFAIRSGIRDGREGRPPYLMTLVRDPEHRGTLLREGWKDVGKIFAIAMALDAIYQIIAIHKIRPLQIVLVPVFLALIPYVILRGPASRLVPRGKGAPRS
ncbi:MAG TPA: hypothetical protein VFX78_07430 [Candidatus Eisenbacteria bacterium]|jgi:hypothetical protein|nr:hypothetical protein [Candidatus Eisenbacteria bacterium]